MKREIIIKKFFDYDCAIDGRTVDQIIHYLVRYKEEMKEKNIPLDSIIKEEYNPTYDDNRGGGTGVYHHVFKRLETDEEERKRIADEEKFLLSEQRKQLEQERKERETLNYLKEKYEKNI